VLLERVLVSVLLSSEEEGKDERGVVLVIAVGVEVVTRVLGEGDVIEFILELSEFSCSSLSLASLVFNLNRDLCVWACEDGRFNPAEARGPTRSTVEVGDLVGFEFRLLVVRVGLPRLTRLIRDGRLLLRRVATIS